MIEKVYVDGVLDNQEQKNLFIHPNCDIIIAYSGEASEYLKGSIASLRMYDKCFSADSIQYLMDIDSLDIDYNWVPPVSGLKENNAEKFEVYFNNADSQLIIQNKIENQHIEDLKIVDLSGRTLINVHNDLSESEIAIKVPQVDSFVVVIVSNNEVFSKLVLAH